MKIKISSIILKIAGILVDLICCGVFLYGFIRSAEYDIPFSFMNLISIGIVFFMWMVSGLVIYALGDVVELLAKNKENTNEICQILKYSSIQNAPKQNIPYSAPVQNAPSANIPETGEWTCPNCGLKSGADASFCVGCGARR
ncbi:MAG: hypothetical protein E7394_06055 [Ruminococcaceae bacterium]|nr:hypothetical protein [Oscillospiraceae bacterium]